MRYMRERPRREARGACVPCVGRERSKTREVDFNEDHPVGGGGQIAHTPEKLQCPMACFVN